MGQLTLGNLTVDQFVNSASAMGDDYAVYALYGSPYFGSPQLVNCTQTLSDGSVTACVEGYMYFDANCKRVPLSNVPADSCDAGSVSWKGSPISLNFAPRATLTRDMTFTQFPLIPGASDRWFTWKASADHPLLVIDPHHTGSITSPYQLFGSWSFGGTERSIETMLKPAETPPSNAQPWKHGFDALATLDKDANGAIEGDELTPLALWFDENRNGISEKGEVRSLADARVTKLFYRDAQVDNELDGYHLTIGFEREIDGKPTTGSSFDWFSPGDTNKDRLIAFELQRQVNEQHASTRREANGSLRPQSQVDPHAPVNGAWEWVSDSQQTSEEAAIGGVITMLAFKNGELRGMSFSESQYTQPYALNSVVGFNHLTGRVTESKRIEFHVQNDHWKLHSTAELSPDGSTLTGKTIATKSDTSRSFSYSWTAKKKQ